MVAVQLDARAGTRSTKTVKFDEPCTGSVFRLPARTKVQDKFVNAVRPKQKLKHEMKQDEEEEFGERKTTRKHDP